jgi:carbon starvation protein
MIAALVVTVSVLLGVAYVVYGRFLSRAMRVDDSHPTPAHTQGDGMDFVPAKSSLLIGQHFSAIAAAGPIVGPILAAMWFGWLPALLWIVLGAIFIGGVHDFASLLASVRQRGASVGELVRQHMSHRSYVLFLSFVWVALVYVIAAFTDITANTFMVVSQGTAFGPGVAVSSFLYILLAVALGLLLRKVKVNLTWATVVFVPLVLFIIWYGPRAPQGLLQWLGTFTVKEWDLIILAYCFVASLAPMWALLQPRGYLGGWLLYLTMGTALCGALFGGLPVQYPAVNLEGLRSAQNGLWLMPVLFITIACGACSGFHGIVSSGTTSKQLDKESDARPVGYGAMLLEALVAVLAIATVMILAPGDAMLKQDPNLIYASGLAKYLGWVGVDFTLALAFALLAFATFVYDTLDVCTRLARYVLQELTGFNGLFGAVFATSATLALPLLILLATKEKGYVAAWPIFGTSNQLMASLILLAVSVWLRKEGRKAWFTLVPMAFMLVMTLWSLVLQILPLAKRLVSGVGPMPAAMLISGGVGFLLLVLTLWLLAESTTLLRRPR